MPCTGLPSSSTRPCVGLSMPEMARMVVVLPAPLAPIRATTVPCFHFQRDADEHLAGAVSGMQILDRQHLLASFPFIRLGGGRRRSPAGSAAMPR